MWVKKIKKHTIFQKETDNATKMHPVRKKVSYIFAFDQTHLSAVSFSYSHNPVFVHSSSFCETKLPDTTLSTGKGIRE